jgi:hypothetical protein
VPALSVNSFIKPTKRKKDALEYAFINTKAKKALQLLLHILPYNHHSLIGREPVFE